ncbi:unnamed protein product [Caenorhabditis angaria]|uniref:Uncharacterized protein n=1 Tax=Caenorhabditis angaria TaxID=860376 RepID=A0A9P1J1I8_9PELO|nr:unnamed protein product [Caenorhabditis angaria]
MVDSFVKMSSSSSAEMVYPTCGESPEKRAKRIEREKRKVYERFESKNVDLEAAENFYFHSVHESMEFPKDLPVEVEEQLNKNLILAMMRMAEIFEAPDLRIGVNDIIGVLCVTNDYHSHVLLKGWTKNLFDINQQITTLLPTLQRDALPNIQQLCTEFAPVLLNIESEPIEMRFRRCIHVMSAGKDAAYLEVDTGRIRIMNSVDDTMVVQMPSEFLSIPPAIAELRLNNRLYFRTPFIQLQYHRMDLLKSIDIVSFDKLERADGKSDKGRAVVAEIREAVKGEKKFY